MLWIFPLVDVAARLGLVDHLHVVFDQHAVLGHGHFDLFAGQHAVNIFCFRLFPLLIVKKLPAAGASAPGRNVFSG